MIRTIIQPYFYINHWIPSDDPCFHRLFNTFFNSWDICLRNSPTYNVIFKNEPTTLFKWRNLYPGVTKLSTPSTLFFVSALDFCCSSNSFSIRNFRCSDINFNTKSTFHSFQRNIKMHLSHR